ncbi:four-carbon acid sugar kinase family protein [Nonomuraea sp. NPDC050643]|uniref:four-carbon acid sugar kinase family protein n=1 Tax=Nonomuraea sp. NPDC050643 TaxID=3155660 RepID=UPI0033CFBE21
MTSTSSLSIRAPGYVRVTCGQLWHNVRVPCNTHRVIHANGGRQGGGLRVFALADDLSGAAEVAAVLMSSARPARIALSGPPYASAEPVLVADLDNRHHPRAAELVREALAHAGDRRVFVKIDSLLRGNVSATTSATLTAASSTPSAHIPPAVPASAAVPSVPTPSAASFAPVARAAASAAVAVPGSADSGLVVLAPALPSAGRTVVGGVPFVDGVPLRETRAWHVETRSAPATVAAALDGVPSVSIPLATVRAGLVQALERTAGRVAICDAETDADLDTIVAAAFAADPRAHLIGAGGLAAALGRSRPSEPSPCEPGPSEPDGPPEFPLLVVVGTAAPGAATQAERLIAQGAHSVTLDANDLGTARHVRTQPGTTPAHRVRTALETGPVVLTVQGSPVPADLPSILGRIVAEALADRPAHLVLTGGETARRVLDALGVRELFPIGQVHHGAVHSRTPQGHSVVTRPGSFGDRDSLLRIAAHLTLDERFT